jgi:hypothetical protein
VDGDDEVYSSAWDAKVALRLAHTDATALALGDRLWGQKNLGSIRVQRRLSTGAMDALKRGLVIVDDAGFMRCPPGTPNAMEFTDHFGANCGGTSGGARRAVRVALEDVRQTLDRAGVAVVSSDEVRRLRIGDTVRKPNPVRLHRRIDETERAARAGKAALDLSNFDEAQKKQMLGYLKKAPGFGWIDPENPKHFDKAVSQLSGNLVHLLKQTKAEQRQKWRRWYDVANKFNSRIAEEYGLPEHLTAAVIARFSPQKDWDQNTAMAQHALKLLTDKDYLVDEATARKALQYSLAQWKQRQGGAMATAKKDAEKAVGEAEAKIAEFSAKGNAKKVAEWEGKLATRRAALDAADEALSNDKLPVLEDFVGKRMDDLSVADASSVIRAHSELEGGAYLGHPEAKLSKKGITDGASPRRLLAYITKFGDDGPGSHEMVPDPENVVRAQDFSVYNSVVRMFRSGGDMAVLDAELGDGSKVRSFYNNIAFPNDLEHMDATIDTHAIAGLLLTPIAASHNVTDLAFTTVDSFGTGQAYAMFRAAMVQAAAEWKALTGESFLPREIQSITWEMMRELVPQTQKKLIVDRVAQIHNLGAEGKSKFKGEAGVAAIMRLIEAATADLDVLNEGKKGKAKLGRNDLIEAVVKDLGLPALRAVDKLPKAKPKKKKS